MSKMIKTIKYNNVPAGEFKWLCVAVLLLTTTIATRMSNNIYFKFILNSKKENQLCWILSVKF